ncbi:hypothetical protein NUW54_g4398 [Trametes sanguinea]|uniref:Uncharacterized protein n=1 Tax=Trametes sanguinea TaxID=158606 RepID=A0ACC1PY64_9APHY|nr:hypothetical protein NUW54_g4398 [Trametes sanguinea]
MQRHALAYPPEKAKKAGSLNPACKYNTPLGIIMSISLDSPAAEAIVNELKTNMGAWLVGTFLTTLFVGMLMQQTFRYFRLYPLDPLYMKLWVVVVVVLQVLSVAMMMATSYYYLVTYFMNPDVFMKGDVWLTPVSTTMQDRSHYSDIHSYRQSAIRSFLCAPCLYDRRASEQGLSGKRVDQMVMVLGSCVYVKRLLGFLLGVAAQAFEVRNQETVSRSGTWFPAAGSALLLAGDMQLTGALIHALLQHRSGIRSTDSMVDILIAYSVSSGLLVCVEQGLLRSGKPLRSLTCRALDRGTRSG